MMNGSESDSGLLNAAGPAASTLSVGSAVWISLAYLVGLGVISWYLFL